MKTKVLTLAIFLIVWVGITAGLMLLPLWVTLALLALLVIDFVFGGERK